MPGQTQRTPTTPAGARPWRDGWATDAGYVGPWGPPPWVGRGPWGGGRPPQVALAVVLSGVLVLGAPRTPPLAAVALLAVALVLVSGRSFPVQSSLWLVPLVAMAGLRWRDHLVWALAEGIHFVAVWLYLAGLQNASRSLPPSWYAVALLLRVAAVVFLAVRAWQVATEPSGADDRDPLDASESEGSAGFVRI